MKEDKMKNRILSVDVLRGMTICLMIIVNNGVGQSFHFLQHSQWNGMTPCDMVFPFFLFIMGVSIVLSSRSNAREIVKRSVLIILLCWAIYWLEYILKGDWLPFAHFRLTGVLPRIALSYCVVALCFRKMKPLTMAVIAAGILVLYSILLLAGNGYSNDSTNIISIVDRAVLGQSHLYQKKPIDPEGLLGVLPSIAHTMLGCICGKMIKSERSVKDKMLRIAAYGGILLTAGLVLSIWLPVNKRIWSPSFVLVNCGAAALLLSLLTYIIDFRGKKQWSEFFRVFGVNSLALYVLSEILACIFSRLDIPDSLYSFFSGFMPEGWASLLYALLFMMINWFVGLFLSKKKIFIRL